MTEAFLRWKRLLLPSLPSFRLSAQKRGKKSSAWNGIPWQVGIDTARAVSQYMVILHTQKYVQHCKYLLINKVMSDDRMNQRLSWLNQR